MFKGSPCAFHFTKWESPQIPPSAVLTVLIPSIYSKYASQWQVWAWDGVDCGMVKRYIVLLLICCTATHSTTIQYWPSTMTKIKDKSCKRLQLVNHWFKPSLSPVSVDKPDSMVWSIHTRKETASNIFQLNNKTDENFRTARITQAQEIKCMNRVHQSWNPLVGKHVVYTYEDCSVLLLPATFSLTPWIDTYCIWIRPLQAQSWSIWLWFHHSISITRDHLTMNLLQYFQKMQQWYNKCW